MAGRNPSTASCTDWEELRPCDLVMKGGITSGVVYPAAIRELAKEYRFVNIGGSSAGAIAAAVCAGAEYGRRHGLGGFAALDGLSQDLETKGFLVGLFQPAPPARSAFAALRAALDSKASERGAVGPSLRTLLGRHRVRALAALLAAVLPLIGLAVIAVMTTTGLAPIARIVALTPPALVLLALVLLTTLGALLEPPYRTPALVRLLIGSLVLVSLSFIGAVAAAGLMPAAIALALLPATVVLAALVPVVTLGAVAVAAGRGVARALKENDFGVCPGSDRDGVPEQPALVDWLDRHIQAAAGRDTEARALTFGELRDEAVKVNLEVTTTDLSLGRPVRVPSQLAGYLFDPRELRARFPERVVAQMEAAGGAPVPGEGGASLRAIDPDQMPILVGARLSLSFPVLLSAMPLYRPRADGGFPRRHLLSDGGICSNFPIHFFDSWFPSRPTFGLDLASFPDATATSEVERSTEVDHEPAVFIADPLVPPTPRWESVAAGGDFAAQIKDAMQNWRDALQSELPGFRERICQIRLSEKEGGLNLNMDTTRIRSLAKRGGSAGKLLREEFRAGTPEDPAGGGDAWRQNRWIRYLTLMQALQRNLEELNQNFADFAGEMECGLPGVTAYREQHDADWCESASRATVALGRLPDQWLVNDLDFDQPGTPPQPEPVLRVVPKT